MKKAAEVLPDTNVILRYLLADNQEQFAPAEKFFEAVRTGSRKALILEAVLAECFYILTKFYQAPREEAVSILASLLLYKGVVNPDREALLAGLKLAGEGKLDFVDCLLIARARHSEMQIFSFDKALNKAAAISG